MKTTDAIKDILQKTGVTQAALAKRLNGTPRLISDRLRLNNMSIKVLNETLRVLDYKIVIMPASAATPKDGYEIE